MSAGISIIAAVADNGVIGGNNQMLWHIPEDFKRFKTLTMGKPCIMGRKTYESILAHLGKPLPGRTSIVISGSGYSHEGAAVVPTLEAAIEKARALSDGEIMVIGGAQIYAQAVAASDKIYLTWVHQSPEGDASFPPIAAHQWRETERQDGPDYTFVTLERI